MTPVWLYAIVSRQGQEEDIGAQRARLFAAAQAEGWTVRKVFGAEDRDAIGSGKDGPRKLLQDLLSDLRQTPKSERPQLIVMTRQDRIGRGRLVDTALILRDIYDLGAKIYTLADGLLKLDDPMDELVAMVRQASASQENRDRTDRARQGAARRKAEGKHTGHPPYGVRLENGKPVAQEPQASLVRELFRMRDGGQGFWMLQKYARAHAPPKLTKSGPKALLWPKATLAKMMQCRTYRAVVVDPDVFDRVSALRVPGMYPVSTEGVWPLRGAVYCSCGRRLSGRIQGSGSQRRRYYDCTNHSSEQRMRLIRADELERAFHAFLAGLCADNGLTYRKADYGRMMGDLRAKVAEIRRQIASTQKAQAKVWEIAESGGLEPGQVKHRLAHHAGQIARLEADLERSEREITQAQRLSSVQETASALFEALPERWSTFSSDKQQEIAQLLALAVGGLRITPDSSATKAAIETVESANLRTGWLTVWTDLLARVSA